MRRHVRVATAEIEAAISTNTSLLALARTHERTLICLIAICLLLPGVALIASGTQTRLDVASAPPLPPPWRRQFHPTKPTPPPWPLVPPPLAPPSPPSPMPAVPQPSPPPPLMPSPLTPAYAPPFAPPSPSPSPPPPYPGNQIFVRQLNWQFHSGTSEAGASLGSAGLLVRQFDFRSNDKPCATRTGHMPTCTPSGSSPVPLTLPRCPCNPRTGG